NIKNYINTMEMRKRKFSFPLTLAQFPEQPRIGLSVLNLTDISTDNVTGQILLFLSNSPYDVFEYGMSSCIGKCKSVKV
ncbi:MAG: hypothetical protein ACE5GK_05055, partial [Nitrospiria bacterium]